MSNGPFSWGGAHAASQTSYHQQQQQQNSSMASANGTTNGAPASGQAPPPTAAGMPALPPEVLAALQGIAPEQLGAIFHALQSGLIPMPPAPVARISATVPAPVEPRAQPSNTRASDAPSNRDIEMREEDGEIEDGELDDAGTPQARGFLRTPPKGPRDPESRRGSNQYQHQTQQQQQQLRPVAVQQPSFVPIPRAHGLHGKAPATSSTTSNGSLRASKEAASKTFVLEMHKAGYKYDDIRREVHEEQLLRRIYNQLDLPVPSGSITPAGTTKPAAPKAPPAKAVKPAAPKDRSEYLAKLQAAKAKKTEASKLSVTPTASTQQAVPQAVPAQRVATAQPSASMSTSAAATPPAPKSGVMTKDKTEEVRRRLEAIKAKRAAEQTAKLANDAAANKLAPGNGTPSSSGAPSAGGLGAGLVEAAASLATQQPMPPAANTVRAPDSNGYQAPASGLVSPPIVQSFGLPGLFTSFAPPSISQSSSATGAAAVPTIKDVASLPAIGNVNGNNAAGLNPTFGDRGGASIDDRCIIALSSDDEDDMDIDDSSDDEQQTKPNPSAPSAQDAPRLSSQSQAATSSPSTPSAYERKLEEIEAFKQQIAEKEKRRKLQGLSATPMTLTPNGASPALAMGEQSDPAASKAATAVSPADPAAIRLARAQEKEALQRRLRELEALRAGHNSGSPMTPHAITPSMPTSEANTEAQSKPNVTTTLPVSLATNEAADEIDDDDDEDLYGDSTEASQHQQAQDTRLPPRVDSQATTVSSSSLHSRVDDVVPEDAADSSYAMASTTEDAAARGQYDNSTTSFDPQAALADGGAVDDADEDEDDLDNIYEPPAHLNENVVQMQPPAQDSSAPDDVDSDEAMDTSEESSDDSDDDEDEVYAGKSGHGAAEPSAQVSSSEQEMSAAPSESGLGSNDPLDVLDLAPELQAVPDDSTLTTTRNDQVQASRYTPYESPLRRFKDYRYHPEYTNTVSGGFKSLTFNHKIDPEALVCPFEIERGQCDVPNCGYQHFHEMVLHDNDLLRLMGTERTPARNPEEDKRWKEGLSNLIRELRTTNIGRDAGLIAQRIAEYRRSFVNDPTRVVLLDDWRHFNISLLF
ncbi:hypothetical protein CKM354_000881200 [Cercospora kikuchii]|uniref:Putative zinc-finger domain-containing protein n=1 Tax=Cercospora kikuchii TaxID=84275 RepID=A0A9P3CTW7_9PEZI|nr:uncharacterized protein CKM354_000881200 [Cercospora kikuchii]GIZ45655.1 hypothetical protein CKM354_000881200 [Cercospora kikuchii]